MYGVVIVLFSVSLFPIRGEISYTLFDSDFSMPERKGDTPSENKTEITTEDYSKNLRRNTAIDGSTRKSQSKKEIDNLLFAFFTGVNDTAKNLEDQIFDDISAFGKDINALPKISDDSAENVASEKDSDAFNEALRMGLNETIDISDVQIDYEIDSAEYSESEKESHNLNEMLKNETNETTDISNAQTDNGSAENSELDRDSNTLTEPLKAGDGENEITDISEVQENVIDREVKSETEKRLIKNEEAIKKPVFMFIPTNEWLYTPRVTTAPKTANLKPHKVEDDERIRKFTTHVYEQALKALESMKRTADQYTRTKIDDLAETYKEKFTEFVKNTRDADIKTSQGTQNVILHTIDTSNLIMERIVNFLKTEVLGNTNAIRQGGGLRLQKELDTVKALEFEHACKMFGVCRSANGFRNELQNIIVILLLLPDFKLLQANDAVTEILKKSNLLAFTESYSVKNRIKKAIGSLERADAITLRKNLEVLFGVLNKSHLPLIENLENPSEKRYVQRTVLFHTLLDAMEDALPPTETNKMEWEAISNGLKRWKNGEVWDIQEILRRFINHVNKGLIKYGESSEKIRELVENIAESIK